VKFAVVRGSSLTVPYQSHDSDQNQHAADSSQSTT
jgi:hypothetical protein